MGNGVSVITVSTDVNLDESGTPTRSATRAEAFGMMTSRDNGREVSHAYVVEFPERARRALVNRLEPPHSSSAAQGGALTVANNNNNTNIVRTTAESGQLARVRDTPQSGVMRVQTIPMGQTFPSALPMPALARSLAQSELGSNALVTNGGTEPLEERNPDGTTTRGYRHTQHIVCFTPPGAPVTGTLLSGSAEGGDGQVQLVRSTNPPQERLLSIAEALFNALEEMDDVLNSAAVASAARKAIRPAPAWQVRAMPRRIWTKACGHGAFGSQECYICLSEYETGDSIRKLPCGHEFHCGCVDKWLTEMHRVCPLCRRDVCAESTSSLTSPPRSIAAASPVRAPLTPTRGSEQPSAAPTSPSLVRRRFL